MTTSTFTSCTCGGINETCLRCGGSGFIGTPPQGGVRQKGESVKVPMPALYKGSATRSLSMRHEPELRSDPVMVLCPFCKAEMTMKQRRFHVMTAHSEEVTAAISAMTGPVKCPLCRKKKSKKFDDGTQLEVHVKSAHRRSMADFLVALGKGVLQSKSSSPSSGTTS